MTTDWLSDWLLTFNWLATDCHSYCLAPALLAITECFKLWTCFFLFFFWFGKENQTASSSSPTIICFLFLWSLFGLPRCATTLPRCLYVRLALAVDCTGISLPRRLFPALGAAWSFENECKHLSNVAFLLTETFFKLLEKLSKNVN